MAWLRNRLHQRARQSAKEYPQPPPQAQPLFALPVWQPVSQPVGQTPVSQVLQGVPQDAHPVISEVLTTKAADKIVQDVRVIIPPDLA